MTVFLKNVETGNVFEMDGENDAKLISAKLLLGKYELVNQDKMTEKELDKVDIPEISTVLPTKNRLLSKAKGSK